MYVQGVHVYTGVCVYIHTLGRILGSGGCRCVRVRICMFTVAEINCRPLVLAQPFLSSVFGLSS